MSCFVFACSCGKRFSQIRHPFCWMSSHGGLSTFGYNSTHGKSPIFRHHFVPLSGGWAPPGPASTENVHCSCQLQELHHCFSAHRWWQRLRCASSKTHTLLLWPSARACTACGTLLWSIRVPDEQLATHMSMSLPRAASPPAALDHVHSTILALFQAHMQQARASGSS